MDGVCPVPTTGSAFLAGIVGHIDCQAPTIGALGYQALANPGSMASIVLTGFLTLFIAIAGIRLLMGYSLGIGDVIGAALKIGIVLALASSWAAYRVVVYDTVLRGPAELVADVGGASGLAGAEGGLVGRLQAADDAIIALTLAGSGRLDPSAAQAGGASAEARPPFTDDLTLGLGRIAFLGGSLGALGLLRIIGGLMLALAPVFAGLLLFEGTRGLFMGWVRSLIAVALGALLVTATLAIELAVLEPWLTEVLALRAARYATPAAPTELLVITGSFAFIMVGLIAAAARIAFAGNWPAWAARGWKRLGELQGRTDRIAEARDRTFRTDPEISRAYIIADAVASAQQREFGAGGRSDRLISVAPAPAAAAVSSDGQLAVATPLGQSYRRTHRRTSASADARTKSI